MAEAAVRLLVVDDHEAGRYALARSLRAAGYEVVTAATGEEALNLALALPSLILLDVNLPDISGFEVLRRLKSDPRTAAIPVLQVSASFVRGEDRAAGLDLGADGYLVQPAEPPELLATVRSLLRARAAEERLRELNASLEARVAARTEELEAARNRADLLAALADALQGAGTAEAVAGIALERLGPALGATNMVVSQREADRMRVTNAWGEFPPELKPYLTGGLPLERGGLSRRVVESGRAAYSDDYAAEPGALALVSPFLAVGVEPVKDSGGRVVALLSVSRPPERGPWLAPERDLLARAASSVCLALERAEAAGRLLAQKEALERQTAELEARNSEQEAFVYTVSHDLRAPLLSLQGMGVLLRDAVAAGDAGEAGFFLDRLDANVRKMGDLLNDLLALSRAGRVAGEPEPVDLAELAAEVVAELGPRLGDHEVSLRLPPGLPRASYPRSELYQVLANLLGNAAKFAGRAGSAPRIELRAEAGDGLITLRVSDSGPGVPPSFRERVFELFRKLDSQTEGTGVGLAIVKRIVERHGGRAWVEDSPPEGPGGAVFAVTVPAAR